MRTAAIAAATLAVWTVAAHAELTLCNRTSYRMEAAIGLEKRAEVSTRGWFRIDPGQCVQAFDGALDIDMAYVTTRTPPVYGSAPLPQNGSASFCVREATFEIANARGCPASQQVPFTPARPSDSPKGPAVSLSEEAGYDDAQARLAGIQRLLLIAGYDASPIDGVPGKKTDAALAKFLADRKLPSDAATAADFFDTLLDAARNPQGPGFSWCNDTKYPVMAALGTVEGGATVTRGWYRLEPGKCLRPDMRADARKVYSYAEAVDANARPIKRGDQAIAWGGDIAMCTRDSKFELSDQKNCALRGLNSNAFATVDLSAQPATVIRFKEPP
jgi:uncharacterized membrane protein